MALLVDSAAIPVGDRLEAFHATLSPAVLPARVSIDDPDIPVRVRVEGWQLGPGTSLLHVMSSGHRVTRTRRHLRVAAPERISLAIHLTGRSLLTHGGVTHVDRAGELELVDLTSSFDYVHRDDGAALALYVDVDQLALPVDVVRAAVPRLPSSPLYDLARTHLHELRRVADEVDPGRPTTMLGSATVEIVRALISSAVGDEDRRGAEADVMFAAVTGYLRRHLADSDLDPARIAVAHHVSVRYLHLLFARHSTSVREWLISERLDAARRSLGREGPATVTIAATSRRWGFSDPGHFARRFRAAYGMSPREWQNLHHGPDGLPRPRPPLVEAGARPVPAPRRPWTDGAGAAARA